MPPGTYRLEVEKQGFKKYVQENVRVLTATISTLDVELAVGAVTESVTVSSGGRNAANHVAGSEYCAGAQGDPGLTDSGGRLRSDYGSQRTPAA